MKPGWMKCLLIGGGVMVLVFVVLMASIQAIFVATVEGELKLQDEKPIMDAFTAPPVSIFMSFYLFNVTNARDVQYYNETPILQEIGPYVYEEFREKFSMEFDDSGNAISYKQKKYYTFREDLSGKWKESDEVTTLNVVMVMMAALGYHKTGINLIWPEIERTMNVFETFTVGEALFQGWDLPSDLNFNFSGTGIPGTENIIFEGSLGDILLQLGVEEDQIPPPLIENKIGYFSLLNDTDDGWWKVSTGRADMDEYLYVREYHNDTQLHYWNDIYCDMINGTDGTQFPPFRMDENSVVRIFVPQLCRSLYLLYVTTNTSQVAVPAVRNNCPHSSHLMVRSPGPHSSHLMVWSPGPHSSHLMVRSPGPHSSHLMVWSPEIPIIMSTPHFYQGNYSDVDMYVGLEPEKELHETYLDLETSFGVPLAAHKRIQINLPLRKFGKLPSFQNIDREYNFPVFWADEWAEVSSDDAKMIKLGLDIPMIVYIVAGILTLVGCTMMGVGGYKRYKLKRSSV
ncbi:sensory neuron membrane protein 2 [Hyalella azteca]|uniref:Sensory neuron membrane protein 2 n=1 Tax=Hyalella azteca TaxID=294128 RepID=A0A8B7N1D1_HYAAZ|nr:sensory neuron membrane protein 2 [Hyalella azteca]